MLPRRLFLALPALLAACANSPDPSGEADPEMKALLESFARLNPRPIESLEAAEARRRKQKEEAAERAKQERDAAYWQSLTPDQQAKLDADAEAEADPESLAMLEKADATFRRISRNLRRNEYIRRLLDGRESPPAEQ